MFLIWKSCDFHCKMTKKTIRDSLYLSSFFNDTCKIFSEQKVNTHVLNDGFVVS